MQLGDLIRRLQADKAAADALVSLGDVVLLARVAATAEAFAETPGEYVAASVGRFAAVADDETWLRLIGDVERASDPGAAALKRMVLWALDDDARRASTPAGEPARACGCGSGGNSCHEAG